MARRPVKTGKLGVLLAAACTLAVLPTHSFRNRTQIMSGGRTSAGLRRSFAALEQVAETRTSTARRRCSMNL